VTENALSLPIIKIY